MGRIRVYKSVYMYRYLKWLRIYIYGIFSSEVLHVCLLYISIAILAQVRWAAAAHALDVLQHRYQLQMQIATPGFVPVYIMWSTCNSIGHTLCIPYIVCSTCDGCGLLWATIFGGTLSCGLQVGTSAWATIFGAQKQKIIKFVY